MYLVVGDADELFDFHKSQGVDVVVDPASVLGEE